jgi:hypothetical protein
MRISRKIVRISFIFIAMGTIGAANLASADEPLRWKFKVGEKLHHNMVQDTTMTAGGGPVPQLNTTIHQELDMTWDVQGIDEKSGEAVIRQKFDHVKTKMTTPIGGFEYDSKSDQLARPIGGSEDDSKSTQVPSGLGAMVAPMYKAMMEGEFEFTMSARGEVKEVKIPEQVLVALKNSPAVGSMGDIGSPEGFKKMISESVLVLPKDPLKKGATWSTKTSVKNPQVGVQVMETTYTYDGTKEIKGKKFAVIRPQLKTSFEKQASSDQAGQPQQPLPQRQLETKVKEQNSEGEVLFDIAEGRLSSISMKQHATMETSIGGQSTPQTIDRKVDLKVTPADVRTDNRDKSKESAEKVK